MKKRTPKIGLERLQKVMAEAGVAARRVCEQMIEAGRVSVNGEVVSKLPVFVTAGADEIRVDGSRIAKTERYLYLMLNKPERTLVTSADEPGMERRTVMDLVDHPAKARLFPVGRLDFETTGLVLLTNDGDLAHRLTHPSFGIVKTYHVTVKGQVDDSLVDAVRTKLGMARARDAEVGEATRSPDAQPLQEIVILRREPGRTLLEITLSEARNREIREVLKMLGAPVKRLTRMGIGALTLRGLPVGAWRELQREEVVLLRKSGKGEKPEGVRRPGASVPRRPAKAKRARVVDDFDDEDGIEFMPEAPTETSPPRPARPERPVRPERRDRPTAPARPARPARPRPSDQPDHAAKPAKPVRPARPSPAKEPSRDEGSARPTRGVREWSPSPIQGEKATSAPRFETRNGPKRDGFKRGGPPRGPKKPGGFKPGGSQPGGSPAGRGGPRTESGSGPRKGPSKGPIRGPKRGGGSEGRGGSSRRNERG